MADTPIATLLAEKGKKYDETRQCISSHGGSIVFLPRDVDPGQIVRVELVPVEKRDARGRAMYQANHAWFDLGKAVRQAIAHEAEVLRSCALFGEQEASALLTARFGLVPDAWKGYSTYYFHSNGSVYASRFSPAALLVFEQFDHAPAKGMVEPLIWIAGGVKPFVGDLYSRRQEGRDLEYNFPVPQLTDEAVASITTRVANGELLLSAPLVEVDLSGGLTSAGWNDAVWRAAKFPEVSVPDFASNHTATIPPLVEFVYGRDINGRDLKVYGVVEANTSWSRTYFVLSWKRQRSEAEQVCNHAVAELVKFREQLETARVRAEEQARRQAAEEAEARRKAEEAEQMAAAVASGRALADFSAFVHTSSQRGDGGGYVIRPDGSLREHDRDEYSRSHQRGTHTRHWDYVYPREASLSWEGFREHAERDGVVHKLPVDGLTPEQRETLARLGQLHGCSWVTESGVRVASARQEQVSPTVPVKPKREPQAPKVDDTSEDGRVGETNSDSPFAKLAELRERLCK